MIKSIYIQNFQSHKDTKLEFSPGVNIIVGSTDSGKTAVLRALRWLAWNRPTGEAFRSDWGGETRVELTADDNTITRAKDKNNTYHLGSKSFTAFGTEPPEEILKVLNLNDINFQSQLDAPFLLSKSPGEIAAHFNRVAHLEKIDTGTRNVSAWIRQIEQDHNAKQAQLDDQKEQLEKYVDLDKIESSVEVLEQMVGELHNLFSARSALEKTKGDIIYYSDKITALEPLKMAEEGINQLILYASESTTLKTDQQALASTVTKLKQTQTDIKDWQEVLQPEELVIQLIAFLKKKNNIDEQQQILEALVNDIIRTEAIQTQRTKELKHKETEFNNEFPDTCPLCGKPK